MERVKELLAALSAAARPAEGRRSLGPMLLVTLVTVGQGSFAVAVGLLGPLLVWLEGIHGGLGL